MAEADRLTTRSISRYACKQIVSRMRTRSWRLLGESITVLLSLAFTIHRLRYRCTGFAFYVRCARGLLRVEKLERPLNVLTPNFAAVKIESLRGYRSSAVSIHPVSSCVSTVGKWERNRGIGKKKKKNGAKGLRKHVKVKLVYLDIKLFSHERILGRLVPCFLYYAPSPKVN